MPVSERFIGVLGSLLEATRGGKVAWNEAAEENTFRVTFNRGMVHVRKLTDPLEKLSGTALSPRGYEAVLFNENNTPIENVSEVTTANSKRFHLLRDLYEEARKSALRPEDVLNDIERELRDRMARPA